jgi:Arc/MetJ-type ribon-helix-helix transcriptional regulator
MYMRSHHITLTEPVSETIEAQVASGRFKDFSAAIQEAVWNYFLGDPYKEHGVTRGQVHRRYQKDVAEARRLKKQGKLKEWKP